MDQLQLVKNNVSVSADGRRFDYELTYKNGSSRKMTIDADVLSVSFNRAAPRDVYRSQLWDARNHILAIGPGETGMMVGSVIRVQDGAFEAALLFPEDELAAFSYSP